MAFFHSFTESIKQKWLQFFQVNRDWITLHMEVEFVYTPDGGKRPPSYLILGVVNALEPKLAQLMLPFCKLNPDADTLVEVLELNFDPDVILGNRVLPEVNLEKFEESDVIDQTFHHDTLANSNEEIPLTMMNDVTRTEELQTSQNGVNHFSSSEQNFNNEPHQTHKHVDEYGDLSFDNLEEIDTKTPTANASDERGFANVLSDVWGAETSSQKVETDNELFLGEESSDDSEIARLFPNT